MRFYDERRARVLDRPCWEGRMGVLPHVELIPEEEGGWCASVILPMEDGGFSDVCARIETTGDVVELLRMWEADPEEALKAWWGVELPKERGRGRSGGVQVAKVEMDI